MAAHHLGPSCCPMSTPLDPLAGPPPNLAQKLAEAALQRQNALLGLGKEAAAPAPMAPPSSTTATASVPPVPTPSLLPPAPPPLPLGASPAPREQVSVSAQARQSLLESAQQRPQAGQAMQGGAGALVPRAAPGTPSSLPLPEGADSHQPTAQTPSRPGHIPALPVWPTGPVPAPLRHLVQQLVQQLTSQLWPQRVQVAQPWPTPLLAQLEGQEAAPGMPSLLTWLVRQGVVQTEQGARSFTATLRVPASWLAQQPTPPASDAAASAQASPLSGPLNAAFAGKAQALQTGSWALLLQSAGAPGQRTSALLTLDFQPLAAPTLYGRELLHVRNDPWLLMAALQASGHVPQEEELVREREAQLCQSPQCPYAGRAPCEQPFCLAQRTVLPSTPATPAGAA